MAGTVKSWKTVAEALADELRAVRPEWSADLSDASHKPEAPYDPEPLRKLYAEVAKLQGRGIGGSTLSALCLSGGGIRSATFNLGVLQALARLGLLPLFDYLSTVSGGGYVGSWLQAWIHERRRGHPSQAALDDVVRELAASDGAATRDPLAPEPKPIDRLREYSNYLTPRKGLLSGDTWAVVAIVVRNLLLNWLVILPALAAVVLVPQLAVLVAKDPRLAIPSGVSATSLAEAALGFAVASSFVTHWVRAHRRGPKASASERARRWQGRMRILVAIGTLGLFVVAAALFLGFALAADDPLREVPILPVRSDPADWTRRLLAAAVWTIGVPMVGAIGGWIAWLVRERLRAPAENAGAEAREGPGGLGDLVWKVLPARVVDLVSLVVSGAAAAGALAWLTDGPWHALRHHPRLVTLFGIPALVGLYALARVVFVAVSSAAESLGLVRDAGDDADREWWARVTGRTLAVAAVWLAAAGLVLLGLSLLHGGWSDLLHRWGITGTAALGAVSSAAVALLGRGEGTSSGRGSPAPASLVNELLLRAAAPIAIASIFVLLAAGTATVGGWLARDTSDGARLAALAWLGVYCLATSLVAGLFVDVNRFSLHRMYRNRLVRAYLGASNVDRRPNVVSGFDPEDGEVRLASLVAKAGATRLFPIVNVTLNLIRGEKLAWQERQAESFTMTPLHCGNFYEGYRDTAEYGSHRGGMTLGTAMAISGAAASPNMGYVSTPALTFLLGLFNARLGVWLANPNENGQHVVSSPGPWHATAHLLRELLGATNRYSPYVNLSDGGHFDNLGLYEVVLRRCRLVVVSDAGCDPGSGFGDLGNALRKIRIDFGIPITFDAKGIEILPRAKDGAPPQGPGLYCAIGTIHYDAVDPAGAPDGKIVYLKPTLARSGEAAVPYDVLAYALGNGSFPHESTADQWFSEAQFESYRALGAHLVGSLVPGGREALPSRPTLGDLYAAAEKHVIEGTRGQAAGARPQPPIAPPGVSQPPAGGVPRETAPERGGARRVGSEG
jgi:hypothetical protein